MLYVLTFVLTFVLGGILKLGAWIALPVIVIAVLQYLFSSSVEGKAANPQSVVPAVMGAIGGLLMAGAVKLWQACGSVAGGIARSLPERHREKGTHTIQVLFTMLAAMLVLFVVNYLLPSPIPFTTPSAPQYNQPSSYEPGSPQQSRPSTPTSTLPPLPAASGLAPYDR